METRGARPRSRGLSTTTRSLTPFAQSTSSASIRRLDGQSPSSTLSRRTARELDGKLEMFPARSGHRPPRGPITADPSGSPSVAAVVRPRAFRYTTLVLGEAVLDASTGRTTCRTMLETVNTRTIAILALIIAVIVLLIIVL